MCDPLKRTEHEQFMDPLDLPSPSATWKTYGLALCIIGGLAVGGIGTTGYFGAISNLDQVSAIIMMGVGGVVAVGGIVGTVKHHYASQMHPEDTDAEAEAAEAEFERLVQEINAEGNKLVYGPKALSIYGIEVRDEETPAHPEVNWDAVHPLFNRPNREVCVLLYIPEWVAGKAGATVRFDIEYLLPFCRYNETVTAQPDELRAGWVLVSKDVIEESQLMTYDNLNTSLEEQGCRMPTLVEAVVAHLILGVYHDYAPSRGTRCREVTANAQYGATVKWDKDSLSLRLAYEFTRTPIGPGVMALQRL